MIDFALQKKLHTAEGEMQLNINGNIESGKFISLYGASGSGKTSILRMLAGLMKPDKGYIKMNDTVWLDTERRINVETRQRKIGFVFQDYALFPNMNVRENIAFALVKNEPKDIVDELLELSGLSNFATRKIQTLSGGQQQRVALARAIARKPSLLLLDEPLSAIDNTMRLQLQATLLEIHKRFELTTLFVSHDTDEVIKLSDAVIHLESGKFQQPIAPTAFFMNGSDLYRVTGNIVSLDEDGSVIVLIENRMMRVNANQDLKVGDKVEINHCDATIIRKM